MPVPPFLYFSLDNPLPATMIAGQTYSVSVIVSSETPGDPSVKRLRKPDLQVEVRNVGDNWIQGGLTRPATLPDGESHTAIELVLTPTDEAGEVLLEIAISGTPLAQQKIIIAGAPTNRANMIEARTPHLGEIPVDTPLPPGFASLTIRSDAQNWSFVLCTAEERVKSGPVPAWANTDAVSLETLFAKYPDRDTLEGNGIWIAKSLPSQIKAQLEKLAASGVVLQIVDLTQSNIPWELTYLETAQGFLGTLYAIVRRVRASVSMSAIPAPNGTPASGAVAFPIADSCPPGEVLAFLADPKHLPGSDPEYQVLQQFSVNLFKQRTPFLTSLEQAKVDVALVYVASHGDAVKDQPNAATLWLAAEEEILATQLLTYSLHLVATARPLIFVNACYSAWMGPFLGGEEHFGLPSPFLRRLARGYLGAVGKVHTEQAAEFGRLFFEKLRAHPEMPVAEILRTIRQEIVQRADQLSTEEAGRRLLDAFMYVYYGIPLLQVQLRQAIGVGGS